MTQTKTTKKLKSFSDLFSEAWQLFIKHFVYFLEIMATILVGMLAIIVVLLIPGIFILTYANAVGNDTLGIVSYIIIFISVLALIFWGVISSLTPILATHQIIKGAEIKIREVFEQALHYFWPAIGISVLVGLAVLVGLILLIIPGIVFAIWFYYAMFVLIDQKKGITESMMESKKLVHGHFWRLFLLIIIVGIISGIISKIPFMGLIASPFFTLILFKFYYELKKVKA